MFCIDMNQKRHGLVFICTHTDIKNTVIFGSERFSDSGASQWCQVLKSMPYYPIVLSYFQNLFYDFLIAALLALNWFSFHFSLKLHSGYLQVLINKSEIKTQLYKHCMGLRQNFFFLNHMLSKKLEVFQTGFLLGPLNRICFIFCFGLQFSSCSPLSQI